ncbi:endonuclease/exonuclease/phosphatase family protein [Streptomyces sp. NPDC048696]|uniref:endonuclease/exonuclease/phosphatase family protein n=1 Tax=Streptomyces sp. NPDC048696 TaxID=3365585 RepID=UPI003719166F
MTLIVMSQNVQYGATDTSRWDGLVDRIRTVQPQLLLLQEVDFLADPEQAATAEKALGLRLAVALSRNLPTAIAWDPEHLELMGTETKCSTTDLHHGYCALQLWPLGLPAAWPVPLVAISTHLTPYSAEAAGQEAQLLCARVYRHGAIGLIGGDINHLPLGDPEPDWDRVPPYNRATLPAPPASR